MKLGTVIGPVWGSRHVAGLDGAKMLRVELDGGGEVVAVDGLRAGPGDRVLVAHGSRVRDLTVGAAVATKDVIVALVDGLDDDAGVDA